MTSRLLSGFRCHNIFTLWPDLGYDLLGWEICWLMFSTKCVNRKEFYTLFLSIMVKLPFKKNKKLHYLAIVMPFDSLISAL